MSWAQGTTAGDTPSYEAYAVLDPTSGTTLTFYYDDQKTARGGMGVGPFDSAESREWHDMRSRITSVVFTESFKDCTSLTSLAWWFSEFSNLTTIEGITYLNTSNVKSMWGMFEKCTSLQTVDLSNFDTRNVEHMAYMFDGCSNLQSLNVSGFNTENVTEMGAMFQNCSSLPDLNVTNFITSNNRSTWGMFRGLTVTTLDLSSFNTAKVDDMGFMFADCRSLTTIYVGSEWTTKSVVASDATGSVGGLDMFSGCLSLVGGAGTAYDANHVDETYARIDGGENAPGYFTDKNASYNEAYAVFVNDGSGSPTLTMYYDENKSAHREGTVVGLDELLLNQQIMMYRADIQTITFDSSFANCRPTSTAYWFNGFSGLNNIVGFENLRTDAVTNMESMFAYCSAFTGLNLSHFNTTHVKNMNRMFTNCLSLTTIYVGDSWSTESVESGTEMFLDCTNLKGGAGTSYSGEHVDYTYARVDGGPNSSTPGYLSDINGSSSTTVEAPRFAFDGDNLSMTTETANASIFYKMAELTSTEESYVESVKNSLIVTADGQQSTYYERPFELVKSAVVKAIAVADVQNRTIVSDTTTLVYDYAAWQNLRVAVERGNEVYSRAQGNSAVESTLLADLQWALEEGNMIYRERAMMNSFEATHFAERITELCNQIEAQMTTTDEPYAVLEGDTISGMTLTFYYDKQKVSRNGMGVGPFTNDTERGWNSNAADITSVVFDESFVEYHPTSTAMWFQSCSNLKSITNIQYLKTDSVTSMEGLFSGCSALESIDLSNFNTDKVTSMFAMFSGCSSLTSLDLSKFNTANVTETGAMFSSCSSLTSLDLSNFNTSNMKNMSSMFAHCTGLKTLDLSGFRFNSATFLNLRLMFRECNALQTIYVDEDWTFPSDFQGTQMFEGCTSLVGGAGTTFSADHTDYTYAHIDGGTANPGYFTDKNAPVTLSAPTINIVDDVLTMTASTAGATIYYTLDGSKPTHQSASYTEPITLKYNCYVRAVAAKEGSEDSEESTRDIGGFSINTKMPAPTVDYDYSSRITLNAPAIYSGTDYSSKVAVEPASWGGVAPDVNLAGEWTCEVLNNENAVTETYTVTLKEDGKAVFPSPCLEESSTWSYNNGILRMTHYKLLTQEGSYQYANYELTSATPENPMEFTGDRTNTVGNWITENNSTAKVRFIYNGASLPTVKVTTYDGRETVMAISNEGNAEKTGDVLQQTITGLENGYYTVELFAKSVYSSASPMADDVTYLFANDVNLFIPLEADKTIRQHNVYLIGVQVTDGTIRLGLGKAKTGANWHALQIRSLQSCTLNNNQSEQGANVYYRMNSRMLEANETDFGYGYISGTKWSVTGDNATSRVARGGYKDSYCLNLTSSSNSTYESAQAVYSFSSPLNKNTYYTLHFKARSASGRGQLQICWQKDSLGTTRSSAETMLIGSELADYDLTFKIENDGINKLMLNFGSVADTYYIDNVQFGAVISDTTNQHRTLYQRSFDVREGVMIQAVSQKQNMTPSAPAFIDYFYKGWSELLEVEAWTQEILKQAYGNPNVPLEMVDKTRAMVEQMTYELYNRREKEHVDDTELLYALQDMEARVYEIRQMLEGFTVDGISYHAVDSTQVEVISSLNSTYRGTITIPAEVTYNGINFKVTSVAENAFANTRLTAIRWYPAFALTSANLQRVNNPNLLIYVQSESQAPANRDNVIVNGVAKNVVLTDASDFGDFNCPETFTAEAIQYTRELRQQTQIGVSRGWEAIALPFTVQTYTHADRGVIAPFGNSASENHFWLRELTQNGLQNAQTIEANKPYIISMPNSEEYRPETNLAGQVTFSALNAIVPVTEATPVEYGPISLVPAFQSRSAQTEIYALNVGEERNGYPEGSVFERDYRTVRPFEAYTLHRDNQNPAPQFIMIGGDMGNGTTGIEELVDKRMNTNDSWYTIDGRRLQGAPTSKGLYIRNGKKVIVR